MKALIAFFCVLILVVVGVVLCNRFPQVALFFGIGFFIVSGISAVYYILHDPVEFEDWKKDVNK